MQKTATEISINQFYQNGEDCNEYVFVGWNFFRWLISHLHQR